MNATPALDVRDLTVSLDGHRILDSLSFTVAQGQTTAIIGPNGAGKSVLLKTIIGLLPQTSGQINILGYPHQQYRKIASRISYIPQHFSIEPYLPFTVRNLFWLKSSHIFGFTRAQKERMEYLTTRVGMHGMLDRPITSLSGGQVQRLLLAYSLMDNPQLLLLDEPSSGIDVQGQETIYALLKRIQEETKITVILISHELEIVLSYCDQVLCLNKKLLCAGIPQEVLSHDILQRMYDMPVGHFTHHHPPHA
jgi:ABC-type Mn2+/Zn2+ transport system ATPase subunit